MIQLSDDFTLSKDTTLGELSTWFKRYNSVLTTVKIGDCLIVLGWGTGTVKAVEQAVRPIMDEKIAEAEEG